MILKPVSKPLIGGSTPPQDAVVTYYTLGQSNDFARFTHSGQSEISFVLGGTLSLFIRKPSGGLNGRVVGDSGAGNTIIQLAGDGTITQGGSQVSDVRWNKNSIGVGGAINTDEFGLLEIDFIAGTTMDLMFADSDGSDEGDYEVVWVAVQNSAEERIHTFDVLIDGDTDLVNQGNISDTLRFLSGIAANSQQLGAVLTTDPGYPYVTPGFY